MDTVKTIELIRETLRKQLKNFICQETPIALERVRAEMLFILDNFNQQGVFNSPVEFELEEHSTAITIRPKNLYSAIALQYASSGLPGGRMPASWEIVGDKWVDESGVEYSFSDGCLMVKFRFPVDFIQTTVDKTPKTKE